MGLMTWFASKALRGSPEVVEALAARRLSPYPAIGGTNQVATRVNHVYETIQNAAYSWLYREQPAVRAVIDYIAKNAAQLGPPKLYERTGVDQTIERPNHPAMLSLMEPNNGVTPGGSFMLQILSDFLVYDNAYALKIRRSPDSPLVLLCLPPHCTGIVGKQRYAPEGYNVYLADGTFFFVEPENMIHWHAYNPEDPRIGVSRLETLREVLAEESAMQAASIELSKSGLGMPGHIERPLEAPEWKDDTRTRFEEDWANRMKAKERRTPVLEEGMEFKPAGMTAKDAEVIKSRQFGREEVASLYGMWHVPPRGEDERDQFLNDVLMPLLDEYTWWLNLQLLEVEFGESDMYFACSLDEKLQGDERLKTLVSASGGPVLTRNESRGRLGLGPLPGADELITPLNVVVGGKPSPQVMPVQDPNKPDQDGTHREASLPYVEDPELLHKAWMDRRKIEAERRTLELEDEAHAKAARDHTTARRAAQVKRRDEYQEEILEMLVRNFDRLNREAKDIEAHNKRLGVGDGETKAISWAKWAKKLQRELFALAKRIVAREGGIQAASMGLPDINMTLAEAWLTQMAKDKATGVADALEEAFDDGDKTKVLDEARNEAGPRAATTLASALAAFATEMAAQQTPDRKKRTKTWIVTSDNSAHPEMNGETVPLDAKFSNGQRRPPADHPGCQCLLEVN